MKLYIITDSISPKAGEWYGTKSNDVYYIDAVDGKYLEVNHYFYAIRDTSPRVQNEEVKKNEFLQEKPFKFASKNEAMKWLKKKHTNDSCRDSNEDIKSAIKNLRLQKGFRISKEGKDALGKKYDYEFVSNKTYNSQNEFNSDASRIADYLDSIEDKYGTRITYNAVVGKSDKKAHFNVDFLRMKDSIKDGAPLKKGDIIGFEIKGEKLMYSLWNVSAPSANNVQELNDSTYYFLRKYSDGTYSTEVKKSISIFVDIDSDKADFSEVDLLRGHGYKIIRFSSKKAGFDWLKQGKKVFDSEIKDDDKKAVFIWASNKLKEASKHGYKAQLYPQNPEAVNERDREIQIDIFPANKYNDYYNHFIAVVNEVYNKMKSAGIDVIKS